MNYKEINREGFLQFFRDDEKLNELTPDDRIEIFRTVLLGSSDITKELLDGLLTDYCVSGIRVTKLKEDEE